MLDSTTSGVKGWEEELRKWCRMRNSFLQFNRHETIPAEILVRDLSCSEVWGPSP